MFAIRKRILIKWGGLVAALLVLAGALWFFWPRPCTYRDFDPREMARLETKMWQAYYAKDYVDLGAGLWRTVRTQFGCSPWVDTRIAYYGVQAARVFQKSTSREKAELALPYLVDYYRVISDSFDNSFDYEEAARLELEWWQLRREKATGDEVAAVLARLYALLNDQPVDDMLPAAQLRVTAMRYRDDRRDTGLSPEEWDTLEEQLYASYHSLQATL
ncbi:hypothetical protein H5P28_01765 [Ruficoccus amylovorans]|uniref:Uncharacterized protein n=1 Tax=Ruficoccus amylovorans TaxID=1804625 RepID=A0A842HBH3_9BACT|nr:hypothetical protein [Ruficoccus amylovorans]MBC2592977.1 hypothetical protein [Ruficoccus amylovorans]